MSATLKLPLGYMAAVKIKREGEKKSELLLVSSSVTSLEGVKITHEVRRFHGAQHFILPIPSNEFARDVPLAVFYHVIPSGSLRNSRVTSVYWEERKQMFINDFAPRVNSLYGGRRKSSGASMSNLEENGELLRLAQESLKKGFWGVQIFGVGRTPESSDPFDVI